MSSRIGANVVIGGVRFPMTVLALWTVDRLLFIWRVMPETKGRSLEEIERSW